MDNVVPVCLWMKDAQDAFRRKNMTDTRKEFEEFYKNEPLAGRECYDWCLQTWQACQQLNDKRIQQLLALVEKKNEALMLQASHMEMYSLQINHANDYAKITRAIDLEPEDVELVEVGDLRADDNGTGGIVPSVFIYNEYHCGTMYTIKTKG